MTSHPRSLAALVGSAPLVLLALTCPALGADSDLFESFETGLPVSPGAAASGQTLPFASGDWYAINHSSNAGPSSGVVVGESVFPAHHGGLYAAFNYQLTNSGTINAWLITPELSFTTGDTVSFYTRSPSASTYPDRLVVRASDNGSSLDVGTGPDGVGDFDVILGTINPTLAIGGYPESFTQFIYVIPFTGSGRIAFNYHVTNSGEVGSNGNFIGIDSVSISAAAIPEPSAYAALAGLTGLGLAVSRRRRR